MRVRLTKKFAEMIDGIDLSAHHPGDILDLERSEARLLIAEGWAAREAGGSAVQHRRNYASTASRPAVPQPSLAAERPRLSKFAAMSRRDE
jgi:hypothetical protein